ncbi:MAG: DUF3899 domain-containing protein [Clostridia bacterium]|nr:DUF3899 domain-containing protein [Clostridia bacterium]
MTDKRRTLISYCVTVALAIGAAIGIGSNRGLFGECTVSERMSYISDGCVVPGIFLTGVGLLILISSTGFFDIFGYAFSNILRLFTPLTSAKAKLSYYDYKVVKSEKHEKQRAISSILVVGVAMLVLSGLFYYLYTVT